MHNFTPEDLIQYLYGEMEATTASALETAVANDWALNEKLKVIAAAVNRMDKMPLLSPDTKILDRILEHAEQTSIRID
jgi:anti-sigma factor RsiW